MPLSVVIKGIRNETHILIIDWTLSLGSCKRVISYLKMYINIDFLASTQNGNDCETTKCESRDTLQGLYFAYVLTQGLRLLWNILCNLNWPTI